MATPGASRLQIDPAPTATAARPAAEPTLALPRPSSAPAAAPPLDKTNIRSEHALGVITSEKLLELPPGVTGWLAEVTARRVGSSDSVIHGVYRYDQASAAWRPIHELGAYLLTSQTPPKEDPFRQVTITSLGATGRAQVTIADYSEGTGRYVGVLVYGFGSGAAEKLLGPIQLYKGRVDAGNGKLTLNEAMALGKDPNCCPSLSATSYYRLEGSRFLRVLQEISFLEEAASDPARRPEDIGDRPEETVEAHYWLASARKHDWGYALLSSRLRAESPIATYRSWWANHRAIWPESVKSAGVSGNTATVVAEAVAGVSREGRISTALYRETLRLVNERGKWRIDQIATERVEDRPPPVKE